jgi:hypothetical protein
MRNLKIIKGTIDEMLNNTPIFESNSTLYDSFSWAFTDQIDQHLFDPLLEMVASNLDNRMDDQLYMELNYSKN